MRRLLLTLVMVLMGAAMVAGSARALYGNALLPLDLEIGSNSSAAAAVLGIGLMAAAIHPANNIAWVRAGILYGFITVFYELGAHYIIGSRFYFGPVIFGLATSLLLIALYPQRKKLVPPISDPPTAYRQPHKVETTSGMTPAASVPVSPAKVDEPV
jgi:hypothetical protein